MFARKALGLLLGVALFSSAWSTNHYPPEAKATRTTVTVSVHWLTNHQAVNALCAWIAQIEVPPDQIILGCYLPSYNLIYAVQPKSFNDTRALEILGHEFWHALGANHP